MIAYIIMFITASHYGKTQAKQSGRFKMFATQLKLAVSGCFVSVSYLLVILFVAFASAGGQKYMNHFNLYKIAISLYSESDPYVLLLCSTPLRQEVFTVLGCMKTSTIVKPIKQMNNRQKISVACI